MTEPDRQRLLDEEHLRLLRIGYFISGGMAVFASLFGVMYVVMGVAMASIFSTLPHSHASQPPPAIGLVMAGFGFAFVLVCGVVATLRLLTARALGQRRSRLLCQVAAGLSCISVPYGTFLGVCTFMVLGRPSVQAMFGAAAAAPALPPAVPGPRSG